MVMSEITKPSFIESQFSAINSWRALQIFCSYRVTLSLALLILFQLENSVSFLGLKQPQLFSNVTIFFVSFAWLSLFSSLFFNKYYYQQLDLQVTVDICVIAALMFASGGTSSGLGVLIAISTSAASLLRGNVAALGFSVFASVAVLIEELYQTTSGGQPNANMTQVGILSVTFMATSLMAYQLARKNIITENVAKESMKGLASMEKLNEEIIQFMSTGVIVVDANNSIKLINRAAWVDLGMPESTKHRTLDQVSTPLARQLGNWRRKQNHRSKTFKNTATGPTLFPKFSEIENKKESAIIFLEDTTILNQRAQSLKLASLGRLTASIAHEIRNPLGALSHAAQLMKESGDIDKNNMDLIEIIEKNTRRVNDIIENIMKLTQREKSEIKQINLSEFLSGFVKDYKIGKNASTKINLQFQVNHLKIYCDTSQLTQILTNLVDNGARHSEIKTGEAKVFMMVGNEPHSHTAFIDIIDHGDGIPADILEKIFEPFFTTSRSGTGLGLYLSKELCEANRARLNYIPLLTGGSCFRITFSSQNLVDNHE